MRNLNFRGENPGAVQYGNFINYYQFYPPETRINLLPRTIWNSNATLVVLDVGCNTGDLTVMLHQFLTAVTRKPCYILGVDIDNTLIERAQEKHENECIKFLCLDFMDSHSRDSLFNDYLKSFDVNKFSVVFCFSLTMWIHLNHGDLGLEIFLKQICTLGEMVVIEPQPWKCYKTAVKRMKQNNEEFPHYRLLKYRNTIEGEIENILTKYAFKIYETERSNWNRKILFFTIVRH